MEPEELGIDHDSLTQAMGQLPALSTSHTEPGMPPVHCRAARRSYRSSAPSREVSSDLTCSWMELISSSVRLRSMER